MIRSVPGIHLGCGLTPGEIQSARYRRSEPSSATERLFCPTPVLAADAIVPCGTTLIPAELKLSTASDVIVTEYLPIADALTTPVLLTDTPGPETVYVTGSLRMLPYRSVTAP